MVIKISPESMDSRMDDKNRMDLVSVIVPIYKVEKYLSQCIRSILAQTYETLQIILVDDGSPDRCGEICEEFAGKDDRITVIHKENGGLSDARNAGMEKALGEWFVFVDSDDYIAPDMIEQLYQLAVMHQAKMAWCAIREIAEDTEYNENEFHEKEFHENEFHQNSFPDDKKDNEITIYSPSEAEKQFYTMNKQQCLVTWNKIYHKSLFNGVLFPKGKLYEDGYTIYRTIYAADKIVTTSRPLYCYRQRKGSIMEKNSGRIFVPSLEAGKERMDFYLEHNEHELFRLELNLDLYTAIHFYQVIKDKKLRREIKKWYKMFYQDYFKKEKWPMAKRIRIKSFLIGNPCYLLISSFEALYNRITGKTEKSR